MLYLLTMLLLLKGLGCIQAYLLSDEAAVICDNVFV